MPGNSFDQSRFPTRAIAVTSVIATWAPSSMILTEKVQRTMAQYANWFGPHTPIRYPSRHPKTRNPCQMNLTRAPRNSYVLGVLNLMDILRISPFSVKAGILASFTETNMAPTWCALLDSPLGGRFHLKLGRANGQHHDDVPHPQGVP